MIASLRVLNSNSASSITLRSFSEGCHLAIDSTNSSSEISSSNMINQQQNHQVLNEVAGQQYSNALQGISSSLKNGNSMISSSSMRSFSQYCRQASMTCRQGPEMQVSGGYGTPWSRKERMRSSMALGVVWSSQGEPRKIMQQKTIPRDHVSHLWEYFWLPSTCGDMNMGLPTTPSGLGKQVAIPKSITLALRSQGRQTIFCSFKSLWQMPIACSAWIPTNRSLHSPLASSSQNLCLWWIIQSQRSQLPGKYSVTMQQLALDLKKSMMRMTCGISPAFCRVITSD